ncbi:hypothetical protein EJM73_08980 [Clostridium botulinum]|uniref:hypothetical protein n=1 Tax=Clostridium botulinum TaxID=1491 RepID=UPI00137554C9|nr:hypothetical protein [Clostridium botulinum]NCI19758.1 hypothetical protein [Clostridium botulinum]NCI35796.1 hypothetical protein [Clostridium botulinum]NCI71653.1 hypothetical protein [Clostridium botulinum]NDI38845.1 hypothetical protein [Clostridium botulinum]
MYENMIQYFEDKEIGDFKLSKFKIDKNNFMARLSGLQYGEYIKLTYKSEIVMSNTNMEKRTNSNFINNAHGDVLIAGLGIGLIVLPIQNKEDVKSITIIEKNQEVIDLVATQLPLNNKVKIINEDIFKWKPKRGSKYDVIYFDIWNYINSNVYEEEMKPLKNRFKNYLRPKKDNSNRFMKCWAEFEAKNNRRLI